MNDEFLLLVFNISNWQPNQSEWEYYLKCLNDSIECKRIMNYKRPNPNSNLPGQPLWLTGKDNDTAKSSMAGRLLIIELTKSLLSIINNDDLKFKRTESNKPYFYINENNSNLIQFKQYNFNVSHDSNWVIALGSLKLPIGIDIMNSKIPRNQNMNDFFDGMKSCFTDNEWNVIKDKSNSDQTKIDLFFIHWCLKESYIKADGKGLEIELQSLEFELNQNNQTAILYINKKKSLNYQFTYFKSFLNNNNNNNNNNNTDCGDDIMAICLDITSKLNNNNENLVNNIITKDNLNIKFLNSNFKIEN